MYSTLTALVIVGVVAWLWVSSLRAREIAVRLARRLCAAEQVQFLDDTVALSSVRPVFTHGRPELRRVYGFEFSRIGDDRARGSVTLTGPRVETVYITPAPEPTAAPDPGPGNAVDPGSRRLRH